MHLGRDELSLRGAVGWCIGLGLIRAIMDENDSQEPGLLSSNKPILGSWMLLNTNLWSDIAYSLYIFHSRLSQPSTFADLGALLLFIFASCSSPLWEEQGSTI